MQGAERTGDEVMTKRNGISLVNVMVFMLFAAMVTAQVFFFMSSSMDSIGEENTTLLRSTLNAGLNPQGRSDCITFSCPLRL